jgi:hypothetical protein
LPLVALQYHEVEIRVTWGSSIESASNVMPYANYVYLDTKEREDMTGKELDIIISQVQRYNVPVSTGVVNSIDLSMINHPVKTLFFGVEDTTRRTVVSGSTFTFSDAELQLNGTTVFEKMSPMYFHVVQSFYHTDNAVISWNRSASLPQQPTITLLYMYNFCLNSTSYRPTGTCNFSRLDNAKLILNNVISTYLTNSVTTQVTQGVVYAVNYNVLKIQNGLGGILFGN